MHFVKTTIVATTLVLGFSTAVVGKGHDQSGDMGDTATTVTACSAFTLGGALGGGNGPSGYPALGC